MDLTQYRKVKAQLTEAQKVRDAVWFELLKIKTKLVEEKYGVKKGVRVFHRGRLYQVTGIDFQDWNPEESTIRSDIYTRPVLHGGKLSQDGTMHLRNQHTYIGYDWEVVE